MNSPDFDGNHNPEGFALSVLSNPSWIVCQLGAREHYSIPRSLTRQRVPVRLITDYWHFSNRISLASTKLQQRFHADIAEQNVTAFNLGIYRFELLAKLNRLTGWQKILQRNEWFSSIAARRINRDLSNPRKQTTKPSVVFSYSYTAKEIFKVARRHGCMTLLGQIDPGPEEMKLVQDLCERSGIQSDSAPPDEYWQNWREECRLADGVIVNSEWSKDLLLTAGLPESKIYVVPLVHEKAPQSNHSSPPLPQHFNKDRPLRVLFLGQVIVRKGVLELIDAISQTLHLPIEWTIVGGGNPELMNRLRDIQSKRKVQHQGDQILSSVQVTGSVPRSSAADYYQNVDVFILPTHSDGYALTQLEAASFGLPVIASRFCGNVVQHGVNGMLLSEITGKSIADSVTQLCLNPQLLHRLACNQKQRETYTLNDLGTALLNVENSIREQSQFALSAPN